MPRLPRRVCEQPPASSRTFFSDRARGRRAAAARRRACPSAPRVIERRGNGALRRAAMAATCACSIGGQKDIRLMTIYGYARLVGYDEKLELHARHPRKLRGRRGPHLHLQDARRPQMVGRQPADGGGFPLLLGGRADQRGPVVRRPAARPARRRQAAALRNRRPTDRSLHLGRRRIPISCPASPPPQPLGLVAAGRTISSNSTRSTRTRTSSRS